MPPRHTHFVAEADVGETAGRVVTISGEADEGTGAVRLRIPDGKAVEANLRGFRAGFDAARGGSHLRTDPTKRHQAPAASLADLENDIARMPEAARAFMTEGVRRLAAYQQFLVNSGLDHLLPRS